MGTGDRAGGRPRGRSGTPRCGGGGGRARGPGRPSGTPPRTPQGAGRPRARSLLASGNFLLRGHNPNRKFRVFSSDTHPSDSAWKPKKCERWKIEEFNGIPPTVLAANDSHVRKDRPILTQPDWRPAGPRPSWWGPSTRRRWNRRMSGFYH